MGQTFQRRLTALLFLSASFLVLSGWSAPAAMTTARTAHSATLLPDGNILIAGGYTTAGDPINSVEISLEQKGTFITVANLGTAAAGCWATAAARSSAETLWAGILNRRSTRKAAAQRR